MTEDLVLIDKVIGVGEVAIADVRASQPTVDELARVVARAKVGGMIAGKAGVTHLHTGPSPRRLSILHELLDRHDVDPRVIYPTHVTRTRELMDDAIALARRGCYVDTDVIEDGTARWLRYYLEQGGPADRLTFSSDAQTPGGTPGRLYAALAEAVREHGVPLERALPHFTSNAADALGLPHKGRLAAGADADLLVIRPGSFDLVHAVSGGSHWVVDGRAAAKEQRA